MGLWIALVVAIVVAGPLALVLVVRLTREVGRLRQQVEALGGGGRAAAVIPSAVALPEVGAVGRSAAAPKAPLRTGDLESAFGGAWLTWLGVLALFFGTAFFLATDLRGSVVAGAGQILIGALVGAAFLVAGRFAAHRAQRFLGLGLLGGGIALLDLAAFAAYAFHRLVPGAIVFPFLFAVAVLGAVLALRENSRTVAFLTLAGALATPLFLRLDGDPARALFPYLVAVVLGVALVATRRAWHALPLVAFAGTAIDVALWWGRNFDRDERGVALAGSMALWLLFGWQGLSSGAATRPIGVARGLATLANGIGMAVVLHRVMAAELASFAGVAIGLLALVTVAAARIARRSGARLLLTEYAGIVIAAIAVPVQFDLAWIAFGWAVLALVLVQAGVTLPSAPHRLLGLGLLALAAFRMVVFDTWTAMRAVESARPFWNAEFAIGACVAGAAGFAAWLLRRRRTVLGPRETHAVDGLAIVAAALLLWRVSFEVWRGFHALDVLHATPGAHERTALLVLSLAWAIYAGIAIAIGFAARYRPFRWFGMAVLGLLVFKVFVFDLQALQRGERIASFVGVGLLLLAISVLYQRERRT